MATVTTTLVGALPAGVTTVTLAAFTNPMQQGVSAKTFLRIDNEDMLVQNIAQAPVLGVVRGVNGSAAAAHTNGAPVVYGVGGDFSVLPLTVATLVTQQTTVAVNGAIAVPTTPPGVDNILLITKAGVYAGTLGAPGPDQNGVKLTIVSDTPFAHTITTTGLLDTASAAVTVITFNPFKGASAVLQAFNGRWKFIAGNGASVS